MAYTIDPGVRREAEKLFAEEDLAYVLKQLAETELTWEEIAPPPRVHVAVLWLSKGDRKRFDYALAGATYDWRDTLMEAGLANEGWREVLKGRGIDCEGW